MFEPRGHGAEEVVRCQKTLRNPIGCVGTGLHTGAKVSLTLHPAEADSGVRFLRYDRPDRSVIPARFDRSCRSWTAAPSRSSS